MINNKIIENESYFKGGGLFLENIEKITLKNNNF